MADLTKDQLKNREGFAKDLEELLKKRNLSMVIDVDFPQYRELPAEVMLALLVLEKHGGKYIMKLDDIEPKKEKGKEKG